MVMPADPQIATGTDLYDLLPQLLQGLTGAQGDSATIGMQILNALFGQQNNAANNLLGLYNTGVGQNAQNMGTIGNLLSFVGGEGQNAANNQLDLLGTVGNQRIAGGGLGSNLLSSLFGSRGNTLNSMIGERAGRGNLAQGIFGTLFDAERQAANNPIGALDQLTLAQRYGTTIPMSQATAETLSQFGLTPGTLTGDIESRLMGFLDPDARIQELSRPTSLEDQLAQMIMGQMTPSAFETGLQESIANQPAISPLEAALIGQIQDMVGQNQPPAGQPAIPDPRQNPNFASLPPLQQKAQLDRYNAAVAQAPSLQSTLPGMIVGNTQPSPQAQSVLQTVQSYAQQAIPQAKVLDIYGTGAQRQAFVQLPNGKAQVVTLPAGGTGLVTIQGMEGPFTVSMDDVAALDQRRIQAMQTQFGAAGPTPAATQYLTALSNDRWAQEQKLSDAFRSANPSATQDLINMMNATPEQLSWLKSLA